LLRLPCFTACILAAFMQLSLGFLLLLLRWRLLLLRLRVLRLDAAVSGSLARCCLLWCREALWHDHMH
jgi:hypothetical protein